VTLLKAVVWVVTFWVEAIIHAGSKDFTPNEAANLKRVNSNKRIVKKKRKKKKRVGAQKSQLHKQVLTKRIK
jgi:hypothetical protein